jgi:25S rRNA (uracil2634-N3)-methyltransferase
VVYSSCVEVLIGKYSDAESNTKKLKRLETTVLHGIDVKRMKFHTDLMNRRFDRIVFNFPHAGFKGKEDDMHMIKYVHHFITYFFVFKVGLNPGMTVVASLNVQRCIVVRLNPFFLS